MISPAGTDDAPFTEPAVEAQRPIWHEYSVSITRSLFRMHGMAHRVLEVLGLAQSRALSLAERGPEDYAESDFERGMLAGAKYGGYREAPKRDGNLKTVVIGCTVTLLSAFVLGAWKLSNDSAALRAEFNEWKTSTNEWKAATDRRMERLENRRQ